MGNTLRRLGDNLTVYGRIQFVEFDDDTNRGKKLHDSIIVGGAAVVDWETGKGCIWQTSEITGKISENEFTTKNSRYVIENTDLKKILNLNKSI